MAILASVFAVLGRYVGRILTMALGWATVLLFGRVPQSRQYLLSFITFGSLAWVVALVGVVLPDVGTFLIAAVPRPGFIDEAWVRIAMLVAALVIPVLVGIGGLFLIDPADRPGGTGLIAQVLRGYPYAAVLALTLVFMAVVAPLRKARSIARRRSDAHIPVVVKPGGYERVADDLERALDQAGMDVRRHRAPQVLEMPSNLLAAVAGPGVGRLVPQRLIMLVAKGVDALIYPSDIHISGREADLARARAAIATRLTFTAAYLTTAKETQAIEDRLERIAGESRDAASASRLAEAHAELAAIDVDLASMPVPYEEWEVLYRLRLQVERDLLANELPRSRAERAAAREEGSLLGRLVAAALGLPFALAAAILGRLVPGSPAEAAER